MPSRGAATCCSDAACGLCALLGRWAKRPKKLNQEEFEKLLDYLGAVPIFRKQLPKAELPRVVECFKESVWPAGTTVVRKGQDGKAFFIIKSGQATVLVADDQGEENERATLYPLDYFGGHTLTERRPNVATIVAKGPEPLVTLSMDREDFEALGLHKTLKFPRRPAIYGGARTDRLGGHGMSAASSSSTVGLAQEPVGDAEVEFISKAVHANPNVKSAFGKIGDEKIKNFAKGATRRQFKKGEVIAKCGDVPQEFFVVHTGSFDILLGGTVKQHSSVEANITNLTKAQARLLKKEKFVEQLARSEPKRDAAKPGRRVFQSVINPPKKASQRGYRAMSLGRRSMGDVVGYGSPFRVGDQVAQVVVNGTQLTKMVGTVVEVVAVGRDGEVLVEFVEPDRKEKVQVRDLRPAQFAAPIATLKPGMCYGEMSLLYNCRLVTTCRAKEDAEVFAIHRKVFKEAFNYETKMLEEHYTLLDDVHLLTPLVRSERWAMARSATGALEYKANERIIEQGAETTELFFYVVKSGSCVLKQAAPDSSEERVISTLRRGGHFGERCIIQGSNRSEATLEAGPAGATVLAIHADIFRNFVDNLELDMSPSGDLEKYHQAIPTAASSRQVHLPLDALQIQRLLGEGGFGSVFLAVHQDKQYALKRLSKGYVVRAKAEKQVALERDILTMLDSDFIIRLYTTYKDQEYVYMLLELCDGGHLFELLTACKVAGPALLPSSVMFYVASITFALQHLHERRIAYRDLKAENVLLDKRGYIKLCDMGFAKFVVDKTHTLLGTPEYMAPEVIDPPHAHDHMVDWWALGVMTFELLTGQDPWYDSGIEGDDPMAQLLAIRDSHNEGFPERMIPKHLKQAKDFMSRLLTIRIRNRLGSRGGAAEVRQHEWFASKSFDFDALLAQTLTAPEVPTARKTHQPVPETLGGHSCIKTDEGLYAPVVESGSDWDAAF